MGCWAAEYGNKLNLSLEEIDSIIKQGKELGTHVYICTGGEPLVRKKDLIKLCEMHPDCVFLSFTNGTLIDEAFCRDMIRVKNFVPAISAEGFEEATDSRRGAGTYAKVQKAMQLLKRNGLPFGVSCCYTSQNAESIASEEYFDYLIDQGALFAWIFSFMPVGAGSTPILWLAPNSVSICIALYVKCVRRSPCLRLIFRMTANCVAGGCIAGGRRYLHINAAGDVDPCVFAHYSNANIREVSLLEALQSPIFMEYYREQPFSDNLLRPCPILENSGKLTEMVERAGAILPIFKSRKPPKSCARKPRTPPQHGSRFPSTFGMILTIVCSRNAMMLPQGMAATDMTKFERLGPTRHPMAQDK